jgi:hypothetical protein
MSKHKKPRGPSDAIPNVVLPIRVFDLVKQALIEARIMGTAIIVREDPTRMDLGKVIVLRGEPAKPLGKNEPA